MTTASWSRRELLNLARELDDIASQLDAPVAKTKEPAATNAYGLVVGKVFGGLLDDAQGAAGHLVETVRDNTRADGVGIQSAHDTYTINEARGAEESQQVVAELDNIADEDMGRIFR